MTPRDQLLFFQPNLVWRCYLGGKLLGEYVKNPRSEDSLFPESWLGSTTVANNGEHQTSPEEGLARLRSGELFRDCLASSGEALLGYQSKDLGVLCKFLDSAIRLPLQCHPDREFARKYCNSEHGKTESWFILETRSINGEDPYILLGFKEGVSPEAFREAVLKQDIPTLVNMLHKVPVKAGDAFFIPGRLPHAIGTGVMMLEVQEPTDLVVQPEKYIGDQELSDRDMWQNLTVEQGLACFDYRGSSREEILSKLQIQPQAGQLSTLIGPDRTDCFQVQRLTLAPGESAALDLQHWKLAVVTKGSAAVQSNSNPAEQAGKGDVFFVPAGVKTLQVSANDSTGEFQLYLIQN